jgi:hypothetical protein
MLGAITIFDVLPLSPPIPETGRVVARATMSGRYLARWPAAYVDVEGERWLVSLYPHNDCAPGRSIHLWKMRFIWGWSYRSALTGCDDPQR